MSTLILAPRSGRPKAAIRRCALQKAAWEAKLGRRNRNAGSQALAVGAAFLSPPPPMLRISHPGTRILAAPDCFPSVQAAPWPLSPRMGWHTSVPVCVRISSRCMARHCPYPTATLSSQSQAKPKAPRPQLIQFDSSQDATTIWRRDRPPSLALRPEGATERAKAPISPTHSRKHPVFSSHFYFHQVLASDCATVDAARHA